MQLKYPPHIFDRMKYLLLFFVFLPIHSFGQKDGLPSLVPDNDWLKYDNGHFLSNNFSFDSFPGTDTLIIKAETFENWSFSWTIQYFYFVKMGNYYRLDKIRDGFKKPDSIIQKDNARKIPADSVHALINDIRHMNYIFAITTQTGKYHVDLSKFENRTSYIFCQDCPEYETGMKFRVADSTYTCFSIEDGPEIPLNKDNSNFYGLMHWLYACRIAKLFLPPQHDVYRFFRDEEIMKVAEKKQ